MANKQEGDNQGRKLESKSCVINKTTCEQKQRCIIGEDVYQDSEAIAKGKHLKEQEKSRTWRDPEIIMLVRKTKIFVR